MPARVITLRSRGMWTDALQAWCDFMRAGGTPSSTVGLRLYHMTRFGREVELAPWLVTTQVLLSWLAAQSWSPNTRRSYRSSLRAFYAWSVAAGYLAESPAAALPPIRVPRALPRPAPEIAYRTALASADPRVWLAMMLAGSCGLRRAEVAAARREDLEPDLGGWSLRVAGKGGHVRLVPVPDDLAELIRGGPPGWLFPSSHGGHLTPHHLGKLVSAALPGDLTMHSLRHRCGTVAYAATHDLRAVQELLGHAKPETTALYTKVPAASIRAAMTAAAESVA